MAKLPKARKITSSEFKSDVKKSDTISIRGMRKGKRGMFDSGFDKGKDEVIVFNTPKLKQSSATMKQGQTQKGSEKSISFGQVNRVTGKFKG